MPGPVSKTKNADLIEKAAEKDVITIGFEDGIIAKFVVSSKGKGYLDCTELKAGKETEKQFRIKIYPGRNQVGATQLVDGNPTSFKYGQLDAVQLKHEAEPEKRQPAPKPQAKPKAEEPKAEKKQEPKPTKATVPSKYSDEDLQNDADRVSTYFQKLLDSGKITGEKARLLYGPGNKFNLIEELKGMDGAVEWLTRKKADGAEKSNAELASEQLTTIIAGQKWGAGVKGFGKFKEWVQSQLAPSETKKTGGEPDGKPAAATAPIQANPASKDLTAKSQPAESVPFGQLVGKPSASTGELLQILAKQTSSQTKFISGSLNKPIYQKDSALYTVEMGPKGLVATKIEMKASVPKPVEDHGDMLLPKPAQIIAAPSPAAQPVAVETQALMPKNQRDEAVGIFLSDPTNYLGSQKQLELLNPKLTLETILADRRKEAKGEDFADQAELDIFLRRYVKESK